jgi:hypothetical protein
MTIFYSLRFETPSTWMARSPHLCPSGTGWPSYILRHWVPFSSILSRRAMMEPPKGISNSSCVKSSLFSLGADPQETPLPLLLRVYSMLQKCFYSTFEQQPARSGPKENAVCKHLFYCYVTSQRTYMLRALPSNVRCLQSHCLAKGLYATT